MGRSQASHGCRPISPWGLRLTRMFSLEGHRSMAYQEALPESCMAAVVTELNQPVELRELPMPALEHGALLVKIEAATGLSSRWADADPATTAQWLGSRISAPSESATDGRAPSTPTWWEASPSTA